LEELTPFNEELERKWFDEARNLQKVKKECFFKEMGWTLNKWDEPILGKMQEDFDKMKIANLLKDAESICLINNNNNNNGIHGGQFMR